MLMNIGFFLVVLCIGTTTSLHFHTVCERWGWFLKTHPRFFLERHNLRTRSAHGQQLPGRPPPPPTVVVVVGVGGMATDPPPVVVVCSGGHGN